MKQNNDIIQTEGIQMANTTEQLVIPYIAHESVLDRLERSNKRMFWVVVGLILAFLISNGMWLYNWMQYDYVDTFEVDVQSDGDGIANYIGDDGDINNGGEGTSTTIENENEA